MASEFADVIGSGTTIRGDVSGQEPLLIRGTVEGTIDLANHLHVGSEGRVVANVKVQALTVEGSLEGTVLATERITLCAGATVRGDLETPRLVIEDEASFTGRILMSVKLPDGLRPPEPRNRA